MIQNDRRGGKTELRIYVAIIVFLIGINGYLIRDKITSIDSRIERLENAIWTVKR